MFRVIIAGGRDFKDYDLLVKTMNHLLSNIKDDITVVCGKARGADTLGEQYAKEYGYSVQYFPADWDRYGNNVVRRWLNKIGEANFRKLLQVRMADIKAHAKGTQASRIERCLALHDILEEVIAQEQCFSMKDLAIRGKDVMSFGVPEGKIVGDTLRYILNMVINGEIPNEIEPQMQAVQQYLAVRAHE